MILSILIASLQSRQYQLNLLLEELHRQVGDTADIEVLTEIDNREISTGAKRNMLLQRATGKYIIFIDDDDWPEPCYVAELMKAAESDADCFAINGWITTNGHNKINWALSKDYENHGTSFYYRKTNHITAVKRELALQAGFPDKSNAEDKAYSDKVAPLCKTEYKIIPPMYHYRFSTHKTDSYI